MCVNSIKIIVKIIIIVIIFLLIYIIYYQAHMHTYTKIQDITSNLNELVVAWIVIRRIVRHMIVWTSEVGTMVQLLYSRCEGRATFIKYCLAKVPVSLHSPYKTTEPLTLAICVLGCIPDACMSALYPYFTIIRVFARYLYDGNCCTWPYPRLL